MCIFSYFGQNDKRETQKYEKVEGSNYYVND